MARDMMGGYDEQYRRQNPAERRAEEAAAPDAPPVPAPPPEEPGAPPGGGDGGPGGETAPTPPPVPKPPMPTPALPPTSTATPVSAGSFARPGMERTTLAPFRMAPSVASRRPVTATPQFGPGTPLGGGAVPAPFEGAAPAGGGGEGLSPEELLRLLQGGM